MQDETALRRRAAHPSASKSTSASTTHQEVITGPLSSLLPSTKGNTAATATATTATTLPPQYHDQHDHPISRSRFQQMPRLMVIIVLLLLLLLIIIVLLPVGYSKYRAYRRWDQEWSQWERATQESLVRALPHYVLHDNTDTTVQTSTSTSDSSTTTTTDPEKIGSDMNRFFGMTQQQHLDGVVASSSSSSSSSHSYNVNWDDLGRRRNALVEKTRSKAAETVADAQRYPPRSTTADDSNGDNVIPVLGVAVHTDPQRFLPRLLWSIDFPVQAIVVTWYGHDTSVAKELQTFLTTFDFDEGQDWELDGTAMVRRYRRRLKTNDKSDTATTTTTNNNNNIPCEELVIVSYPTTNLGCSVGFNNPIMLYPSAPYWLLVNYDIAYPPGVLQNTARTVHVALHAYPNLALHTFGLVYGRGRVDNPWSNFVVTAKSVAHVGLWDENIFPAYYEDDDYRDRVRYILGSHHSTTRTSGGGGGGGGVDEWIDEGVIVEYSAREVAAIHGPLDATGYVSGNDLVIKANPAAKKQWAAFYDIAQNGQYFWCKHGNLPRVHIFGIEYGNNVKRYFAPKDRFSTPFNNPKMSWDEWSFNSTRRACVHGGVHELVSMSGWQRWRKATVLAKRCSMCP